MSDPAAARAGEIPGVRSTTTVLRSGARWAIAMIVAGALLYLLMGVFSLAVLVATIGRPDPRTVLLGVEWVTIVQNLLYLAGGIVVLVWLRGVNVRLRAAGRQGMKFSPGWTVGWFLIPFANFVFPPQVMQELWRASAPEAGPNTWQSSKGSPLPALWWYPFLAGNILGNVATSLAPVVGTRLLLIGNVITTVLLGVGAFAAVRYIRQVGARMSALEGTERAERPSAGLALLGAAVGGAVSVGAYTILFNTLGIIGLLRGSNVLMFLVAFIAGAVVGYWTAFGAGGRSPVIAAIAGVTAYLALSSSEVIQEMNRFMGFAFDLERFTRFSGTILLRTLTNPYVIGASIAAALGAVVIALVRLPFDPWRVRRVASTSPAAVTETPAPMAAAVNAVPPVAPNEAQTAPAAPQAETTAAPMPSEDPAAIARKRRTVIIAVAVGVALLLGCGLCATAALVVPQIMADRGSAPAEVTAPEVPVEVPAPEAPSEQVEEVEEEPWESAEEPVEPDTAFMATLLPDQLVIVLYAAASAGDMPVVQAAFAQPSDFDPAMLATWGDPDFAVEEVTDGEVGDEYLLQVREAGGGISDEDTVTYTVRRIDGSWLIVDWRPGGLAE
ncbi:DUF4328 domain-containing protein [Anaerosoma tenue]|uniref:DUF4328 domain-containing protein n=1 Tax=Anaerosoma tenue TaxID=2933588 RepID=UPI002260F327|nr:DUF4328 domain-containing protein [Anaerosoma tenue]MCK8114777.1 DUF4328 domain-containing protein [Anaerosoma tenue]